MSRLFRFLCPFLALTTLTLIGCSKDDSNPAAPVPDPVADFTMSGGTVTPATITFNNTSTNADTYQWDFGDGRTSILESPQMVFNTHGTFTVVLVAKKTSTLKTDTTGVRLTITPGMVFLDSVVVESIPWVNDQGAGWDEDGTGPDIFPAFVDSNLTILADDDNEVILNAAPADLPQVWSVEPEERITDWGMEYGLILFDVDLPQPADIMGGAAFSVNEIIRLNGYVKSKTLNGDPDITPVPDQWRVRLVLRWQ